MPRPPPAPTSHGLGGGRPCVQRRVLDLVLAAHPVPLGFHALAMLFWADPADLAQALAIASAVRDLALADLLASDGLRIVPTRAALAFARLEAGR